MLVSWGDPRARAVRELALGSRPGILSGLDAFAGCPDEVFRRPEWSDLDLSEAVGLSVEYVRAIVQKELDGYAEQFERYQRQVLAMRAEAAAAKDRASQREAERQAMRAVPCASCGAGAGAPCVSSGGRRLKPKDWHASRQRGAP